jgi:NACalpha-BTF3-like transcription factor
MTQPPEKKQKLSNATGGHVGELGYIETDSGIGKYFRNLPEVRRPDDDPPRVTPAFEPQSGHSRELIWCCGDPKFIEKYRYARYGYEEASSAPIKNVNVEFDKGKVSFLDVQLVSQQAKVTLEKAFELLCQHQNDPVNAIMYSDGWS